MVYSKYIKRFLDVALSLLALIVLSPFLVLFSVITAFAMKGNPFFTQKRPGKDEKIFKLIKFRNITCEKDADGNLLPDEKRITGYGKFLRSTSLDELPELINILKGDMSIIGPRPLLVKYLELYDERQKHRHDVRPGLTGLAQINGRNAISWEDKFELDIQYIENITLLNDVKIIFGTLKSVVCRTGISAENSATMEEFKGTQKIKETAEV